MPVKILFLDFDGVLNSHAYQMSLSPAERKGVIGLDPAAVARLNGLLTIENLEVVVSSTWRLLHEVPALAAMLREHGFRGVVRGRTPRHLRQHGMIVSAPCRGQEIQAWLHTAPDYGLEVENFAIVDDDSDMAPLSDRLVKTHFATGLLDEHVERIVKMLSEPMPSIVKPTAEDLELFDPTKLRFTQ